MSTRAPGPTVLPHPKLLGDVPHLEVQFGFSLASINSRLESAENV
jgi:hypothetical protein